MRSAVLGVQIATSSGAARMRDFLAGYDTSVCYNHHSAKEPDWRNQLWGSNYARLAQVKADVDPDNLFNVYHTPGYIGPEFLNDDDTAAESPTCKRADGPSTALNFYIEYLQAKEDAPILWPLFWLADWYLFRETEKKLNN